MVKTLTKGAHNLLETLGQIPHDRSRRGATPYFREMRRGLLVVDDTAVVGRAIERLARDRFEVHHAASAAAARAAPADLAGAIVDLLLPDGSGFDVVAALRERQPELPVLLLTAVFDRRVLVRAHAARVEYLCKPAPLRNIEAFLAALHDAPTLADACLTPRERDVLDRFFAGACRAAIAAQLGMNEMTVKAHVRGILRKTGASSLSALAVRMARRQRPTPAGGGSERPFRR